MANVKHDEQKQEAALKHHGVFDRFFDDWPELFRRPVLFWPERTLDTMRVEEFSENGALIVRIELPGIDADNDLEVTVDADTLHIRAERREEEKTEGRDYVRREHRYGSYRRDIPLAEGTSEPDIQANYKDGILEIRLPMKKVEVGTARKIPVAKT